MSFTASPDDENPLSGVVYAFDANAYSLSSITKSLADTGKGLTSALGSKAIDDAGNVWFSGKGLTDNGADPKMAAMYAIIISTNSDGDKYFYATEFNPVEITDAVASGDANFTTDYINTGLVGSKGWTELGSENLGDAPEPTSGLLLLLGVASLALHRKQA
jgi:hypothetical protein